MIKNYDINNYNFMNLDIQGAELLALKGSDKILHNIKAILPKLIMTKFIKIVHL